ncbi:hypothetical protein KAW08_01120 [bacterium]|nr:hypothetical protein [bacterium]
MSLLGLDVGTTGCKAVVFDIDGKVLAQAYREYPLIHSQPSWSELDTDRLWKNVTEVLLEVNQKVRSNPVKALSVSCQGEAVTAIDKAGKALCNFSVSFDHRTIAQAEWWRENFGAKKLFCITGMPLHAMYTINKIMWYKENCAQMYAKAVKFLCVEDFINYRLTGRPATDWSLAGRTMAFDVTSKSWSDEVLTVAQVDKGLLPDTYPSGTVVGEVTTDVACKLGFENNVIVATGGHDQPCGALGAGITEPGIAMNATGTSDVICPAFAEPVLSEKMLSSNYSCYSHVVPGRCVSIAFNLTGGLLLRWYRDTFCDGEQARASQTNCSVYEVIIEEASPEVKNLFFLPHFVGSGTPYLDSHSMGALVGLTVDTTKQDVSKAVLDSINYEMKLNIDLMNQAGLGIRKLRAIGGGSKSRRWLQMKADTFGMAVASMKTSEAASLGAAILAGISIGTFKDAHCAVEAMVHIKSTYYPDEKQSRVYQEKYELYKELYPALKQFNFILR